jgi:hypothetical protein
MQSPVAYQDDAGHRAPYMLGPNFGQVCYKGSRDVLLAFCQPARLTLLHAVLLSARP